ncbi:MAG TPA: ABC transporter permease [Actinomycetota bacterium]|nr:ABC transporter permease [Actinomycetota bacterium]
MSDLGLALRLARFTNKAFWRNPASAFFTFAFPLLFLVVFTSLLGSGRLEVAPGRFVEQGRYYVAAMGAFGLISATYTNLAMSVTFSRDAGVLKRIRGTPIPGWVYLTGRVLHAMGMALLLVAITAAFGAAVYGADLPTGLRLGQFFSTVVVGGAAFSALGLATTSLVPNAHAAPAVVNAIVLPLLFLSGIFIPLEASSPRWIVVVGDLFPVKPFAEAVRASFYGPPFAFVWSDLAVVAGWGVAGLLLAVRFFSWEPRR